MVCVRNKLEQLLYEASSKSEGLSPSEVVPSEVEELPNCKTCGERDPPIEVKNKYSNWSFIFVHTGFIINAVTNNLKD